MFANLKPNYRDDATDQRELINEIGNRMSEVGQADVDEEDLAKELEDLEQENLDEQMLKSGSVPHMPVGPTTEREPPLLPNHRDQMLTCTTAKGKAPAVAAEEDEEEELRKLQLEMAM